jgi:TonB-dependent receptor
MKMKLKLLASGGMVALFAACLSPAFAQTATPPTPADNTTTATASSSKTGTPEVVEMAPFVVSGFRASLASAEDIKQSTQQVVDSIVASDIDKLPDMNVAYALSRIPGIQVAHTFAGLGGNGAVTIHGLTQVENAVDGREVFTPGGTSGGGVGAGQRTFDYSQIPSALVAGIDVYKTSAADQLDGGLGGLIDVRVHKPFDFGNGLTAGVTVGTTYSQLHNQTRPNYNLLISDSAMTGIGKIGVLVNASYQVQPWREDNIGVGNPTPATSVTTGTSTALIASGYTTDTAYGVYQTTGVNAVLQWQPFKGLNLYAGTNYNQWWNVEDQVEISVGLNAAASVAGSGQMFPGSTTAVRSASFTNVTGTAFGIIRDLTDRGHQYYVGGDWTSGDLTLKLDLSRYITAYGFYNNGVYSSVAIPGFVYDLGETIPSGYVTGASLMDPSIYKLVQIYNRLYPSTGYQNTGTLDAEYRLPKGFFTSILAGVRYARTEDDNGTTGLYLGSYNLPSSANLLSQHPGLWRPSPVQNFFSGYGDPTLFQYLAADTSTLRNANSLLAAYGDTTTTAITDAAINPLSLFHIDETTTAIYIMPKFAGNVGGLNFDGNIGLRAVQTKEDLGGFQTVTPAAVAPGGVAVLGPLSLSSSYTDWLPSFNYRLKLTDSLYLRLAASKTITRPNFSQISPSLTLNQNPITPSLNSGSQGNPDLQPMRSTNYDLSLEDYLSKSNLVYAAAFYKKVTGFPASLTQPETYGGVTYQISTYANLNPATIKGAEVGYQQFFTFLPAPFDGLGFQANFTYVQSSTPSTIQNYNIPLTNLSRKSYNAILMYEKGPFSARIAYNWRDKYVTGVSNFVNVGLLPQIVRSYGDLDASLNYNITKNIEISVQGVNLTNTLRYQFWGSPQVPSNCYLDGMTLMGTVTIRL